MKKLQAIRGMHDILPDTSYRWQNLMAVIREVLQQYSYREIQTPVVESTELFKRSIGEVTDIVEKEMYTFSDRNGDSLTLRPEGTASCVRAGIEHGLFHNQLQRLWYAGPMFRHERPQKGRYRQFHQVGVEAYGMAGPDIDIEVISLSCRLWKRLGLLQDVELQINTLGEASERSVYRESLVEYFQDHRDQLDEDSLRRLESNPLRILDSKNPELADLIRSAPEISACLEQESQEHFAAIRSTLDQLDIPYRVNPRLVRGLDYYSRTVFEWVTDKLGAQAAVCAGGRYDGLVEQLGGRATPAFGFAMGLERLLVLLESAGETAAVPASQLYVVVDKGLEQQAAVCAERLRDVLDGVRITVNCGGGSFKSQFKRADRSGADFAVVVGGEEWQRQEYVLKPMRTDAGQEVLAQDALKNRLKEYYEVTE